MIRKKLKITQKVGLFCKVCSALGNGCFLLLFGGLILSGCADSQEDGGDSASEGVLSIGSVSTFGAGTRSTTSLTNGSIGVFRLANSENVAVSDVEYMYSSGWSSDTPVSLGSSPSTICVYSPYGSNGIDGSSDPKSISLTSGIYSASSDLCYYSGSASAYSSRLNPVLAHAYARLRVNITRGSLYTGTGAVSNLVLSGTGVETSAVLDMTTGSYSGGVSGSVSFDPGITGIASGDTESIDLLLVPCAPSDKIFLSLNVDGEAKVALWDVSLLGLNAASMAGKSFELNVQLGEDFYIASESNCYIVPPGGSINIPVSRANASDLGTQIADVTTGWSSEVIWRDNAGLIISSDDAAQSSGAFTVNAADASATGNALVCIKDGSGTILWSWQIWVTDYNPSSENETYNSYTFMDRNLGATSDVAGNNDALGLMYQWGRKDPFAGASATASGTSTLKTLYSGGLGSTTYASTNTAAPTASANNLETSVRNPGVFYYSASSPYDWYIGSSTTQNDVLWGVTKTVYDPCPSGWKVAPLVVFSTWSTSTTTWDSTNLGCTFTAASGSWYPASGSRDFTAGALSAVGAVGFYWSSAISAADANLLYFNSSIVFPAISNYRARSFAVRCVQD